jgi:hypothetical protein
MAAEALLTGIREIRRQLEALETLASEEAAATRELTTPEVARLLGLSPEGLTHWARSAGIGASRDGFRLVRRSGSGPRPHWIWKVETHG